MTSSTSKWIVGQAVVIYRPYKNEDKIVRTLITGVGRKYISVGGMQSKFDLTKDPPASSSGSGTDGWLHTPEYWAEFEYKMQVVRELPQRLTLLPVHTLVALGDHLGIKRPDHLRDDIDPRLLKASKDVKPKE